MISIGGPLGLEGTAAPGLDAAGLDGDEGRAGEIGAFKPDPPDEAAFAGGK